MRMTIAVMEGLQNNLFEDGKRMEQLDIIFASRYLQAWDCYCRQQHCSNAWYTTFEARKILKLVILQHLMAGVNAHINLELGIAAATIAPGEKIFALKNDFNAINNVIALLLLQYRHLYVISGRRSGPFKPLPVTRKTQC